MKNKSTAAHKATKSLVARMAAALALSQMVLLAGCEKGDRSYSLLSDTEAFQQSASYVPRKIDILWIIDNSGSMKSSQDALVANFSRFINRFQLLNYDFRMGVNTTDAWQGRFNATKTGLRRLKDGVGSTHSGVFVIDKDTPNMDDVFLINASLGINGSGDERAFSSMEDTLNSELNLDFRRPDAYLAIIIVSDEDDFSATSATPLYNNYSAPRLIPVSTYKTIMDNHAGVGNWSVNAITIQDAACRDELNARSGGRIIGHRYMELSALSGGVQTSLCGDFGTSLELISDLLIEVSSSFKLDREPIPSSIRVLVDDQSINESAQNGWSYDSATMILTFNGTAVPAAGQKVVINYDPVAPKN